MRPRSDKKRREILEIARRRFLSDGYSATSMAAIAAELGGSKGTLYGYYSSKEDLFAAVIESVAEEHVVPKLDALEGVRSPQELRAALTIFAAGLIDFFLMPDAVASYRLVVAEAGRFPELGKAFYESGQEKGELRIADWLQQLMEGALIRTNDSKLLAKQFISLCEVGPAREVVLGYDRQPGADEKKRLAGFAVETFLRAHGIAETQTSE